MKYATAWWGVQMLAETDEDKKILEDLYDKCEKNAFRAYEEGGMYIAKRGKDLGFMQDEIDKAKLVIEIYR